MTDNAIFIITHGRPTNQLTYKTLRALNVATPIYMVLDDEDTTVGEYCQLYGCDRVIVFNKLAYINSTDTGLHEPFHKFAVFARNAVEDIARSMGLRHFLVLDDDIIKFRARYEENNSLKSGDLKDKFDAVLEKCFDFMDNNNLPCTSFGFTNVYRSGVSALYSESSRLRLCAEAFIRSTAHDVSWRLNMLEDLITSLDAGREGFVWLQLLPIQVEIVMSEGKITGGNSAAYNEFGKYRMNFMPTVVYPDCNSVRFHNGEWRTTLTEQYSLPKVISDSYKKR